MKKKKLFSFSFSPLIYFSFSLCSFLNHSIFPSPFNFVYRFEVSLVAIIACFTCYRCGNSRASAMRDDGNQPANVVITNEKDLHDQGDTDQRFSSYLPETFVLVHKHSMDVSKYLTCHQHSHNLEIRLAKHVNISVQQNSIPI